MVGSIKQNELEGVVVPKVNSEVRHPMAQVTGAGDSKQEIQEEGLQDVPIDDSKPASEVAVEETLEARIERLGRERPAVFRSLFHEIGFVFSISMSVVMAVSPHPIHFTSSY